MEIFAEALLNILTQSRWFYDNRGWHRFVSRFIQALPSWPCIDIAIYIYHAAGPSLATMIAVVGGLSGGLMSGILTGIPEPIISCNDL